MESHPSPEAPRPPQAVRRRRHTVPANKLFPAWELALKFGWIAGLVAAGAVSYRLWKPETSKPLIATVHFAPASQWTAGEGLSVEPAVSPDGKRVAFSSDRTGSGSLSIWMRPFDSGEPVRVTSGEFNESQPDFSPDRREIAFRSEQDGGGIYAVPAVGGGQPRLIAKSAWRPKYSPDGKWIAFYTLAGSDESGAAFGAGKIFIVPPSGGEPRPIQPDFPYARYPIWSPDGQRLLFAGTNKDGAKDWWVTPIDGGPATRIYATEFLNRAMRSAGFPEQWRDGRVYFSGAEESAPHVWALPVSASTTRAEGPPRRLTDGTGSEQQSAIGPGGRMLYSSLHFSADIWTMPIDSDRAEVRGKLKALTNDGVRAQLPSLSSDGSKMIYLSDRSGLRDIWVADPDGSGARAVTSFRQIGFRPLLSPDGKRMVYPAMVGGKCAVIMEDLAGRARPATLEGCFEIWDWSPDGSALLTFQSGETRTVELRKIASGEHTTALSHPTRSLLGARFSPDGRWIAFAAGVNGPRERIFIAPFRGSRMSEREWIAINPDAPGGDPAWSPEGNVLYFHSKRDGYHCIWAQKLGPGKQPIGEPIAIQHLHATGFGIFFLRGNEFGLSLSRDRLTMNLAKATGEIWKTTVEAGK